MPDNRIMGMNTLGTPDDNDHIEVVDVSEILPSNQNKKFSFLAFKNYVLTALTTPLHKNTHVIGGTDAFVVTDLLNAVAKIGVRIANILIGQRRHINFIAGTNVTITALDDNINEKVDVTINSTVAGNVGDITGGLNVGTGENIFLDKVTNDLRFKTARGTGIVTVTTNVNNELEINVPAPGNTVDVVQNVGTGEGVWKQTVGNVHDFKSAVGSPSVTITNNSNDLTFTANDLTTISHTGGGLQIAAKTGLVTTFNTLQAGTNMSIVPTLGTYVINTTAQPNAGLNLGAGQQVFKQVNAGIPEYRTLLEGTGISLASGANSIQITNTAVFNDRWISNVTGVLANSTFITNSNFATVNQMTSSWQINAIPVGEYEIFGNNNRMIFQGTPLSISDNTPKVFSYLTFIDTDFSSSVPSLIISSGMVTFKNCVFYNDPLKNNAFINITGSTAIVYFENCVFKGLVTATRTAALISFTSFTGVCTFKDCILSCNDDNPSAFSVVSNTAVNVRLLGKNYAQSAADANVTFLTETLTVIPSLIIT